jgi:protein-S-isoprenylcysteine O-methyltransferase Ste14
MFFYIKYADPFQDFSQKTRNRLILLIIVVMVLTYLFIAASFAPSAYGQSYPVPRARFTARVIMTVALMVEGALLGVLVAQLRPKSFPPDVIRNFGILVLAILALYPLKTAWRTSGEIPAYQERAAVWDARESEILAMKAQGQMNLAVRFLSEVPIQDLGDHKGFRLNRCAAALYGVNTIVAVPMSDP